MSRENSRDIKPEGSTLKLAAVHLCSAQNHWVTSLLVLLWGKEGKAELCCNLCWATTQVIQKLNDRKRQWPNDLLWLHYFTYQMQNLGCDREWQMTLETGSVWQRESGIVLWLNWLSYLIYHIHWLDILYQIKISFCQQLSKSSKDLHLFLDSLEYFSG